MNAYKRKKEKDSLDFEIEFFEKLLRRRPEFIEVLRALGDAYTQRGYYAKGLAVDKKLAQLRPDDALIFYNLACSYSLMREIERSLEAITRAIELGYDDFTFLHNDADLENLRADIRFRDMMSKLQLKL
ncbi:hypothetical protein ACFL1E_01105 [Candidatus Omnitrophota bacterium]